MVIYLSHPQHGTKVAICEPEAIEDERNGWVRDNTGDREEVPAPVVPKRKYTRRS